MSQRAVKTRALFDSDPLLETARSYSDELAVLPSTGVRDLFSVAGDSGAWIVDEKGNWIGMIFGGDDQTGIGYVSDAQFLLERLQAVPGLGMKINIKRCAKVLLHYKFIRKNQRHVDNLMNLTNLPYKS